jgi:hypothetical protein
MSTTDHTHVTDPTSAVMADTVIHEITDERPATALESSTYVFFSENRCNDTSSPSYWSCTRVKGHDGLHIGHRAGGDIHCGTWGTAAMWEAAGVTVTPTEATEATEAITEPTTPAEVTPEVTPEPTLQERLRNCTHGDRDLIPVLGDAAHRIDSLEAQLATQEAQAVRDRDRIESQQRTITEYCNDGERIAEALLDEAERRSWCSEYDSFVDSVNSSLRRMQLTLREQEYTVTSVYELVVTQYVTARSEDDAIELIEGGTVRFSIRSSDYGADISDDSPSPESVEASLSND